MLFDITPITVAGTTHCKGKGRKLLFLFGEVQKFSYVYVTSKMSLPDQKEREREKEYIVIPLRKTCEMTEIRVSAHSSSHILSTNVF